MDRTHAHLPTLLAAVSVALASAVARATPPDNLGAPPHTLDIAGGMESDVCAWPTTVALFFEPYLCSATLVHPQLVVYAAHCGDSERDVIFGEIWTESIQRLTGADVEFCRINPGYSGGPPDQGDDWGFCKLARPVDLPVTPVMFGCETERLVAGAEIALVGFGHPITVSPPAESKKWVKVPINSVEADRISHGGGGRGVCQGDSGGSAFMQYEDGSWHLVGITSSSGGCGGEGVSARVDNAVAWLESESGVDITPCHDADGTWNPTVECGGFLASGEVGHGDWTTWCAGTPVSGFSATCGAAFEEDPGGGAPDVGGGSDPPGASTSGSTGGGTDEGTGAGEDGATTDSAGSGVDDDRDRGCGCWADPATRGWTASGLVSLILLTFVGRRR